MNDDPYLRPQTSLRNRLARLTWGVVYRLLFRPSPRPLHAWRAWLLRCFGAKLGQHCHMYPGCRVWAPWNLVGDDYSSLADGAVVYNAARVYLGSHAVISQDAYLCTATHDLDDPSFPMISTPISIGAYAWVCARASVMPGVTLHEGAVLGLGSVATHDLEAWNIYAGLPATRIRERKRHSKTEVTQ